MSGPRSIMTVPANREDMLTKAPAYGADALIFDLEDSVPVADKPRARALAAEYIGKHKALTHIYVRVNAWDTGMTADDIADVVAAWTGIPAGRLLEGESAKLLRMEEEIGRPID